MSPRKIGMRVAVVLLGIAEVLVVLVVMAGEDCEVSGGI